MVVESVRWLHPQLLLSTEDLGRAASLRVQSPFPHASILGGIFFSEFDGKMANLFSSSFQG